MNKLYLNNPYIKNFRANILNNIKNDDRVLIVLDKTAFYPESGGQPSDTGYIGDSRVSYVYEENDVIYHVVDKEPLCFENVECSIDWCRRFDHMQQHCGQHILSCAFKTILKGNTVGFHLGNEYVTVDIDIDELSSYDAERVELLSNDIVLRNLPIRYHYPKFEDLSNYNLRKAPSVEKNIRIVEIDQIDYSPCGGTHPAFTGEVGLIKIRKWEKNKNAIRVEFVCGLRALRDYVWKNNYINEISNLLSSKDIDVLENVKKSVTELHTANKQIRVLKDELLKYEAEELYSTATEIRNIKIVAKIFSNRDFKDVTVLSGKIVKNPSVIALLGVKSNDARMIFARSTDINIKMNDLFKEVLPLINGKGGGSPQSAQGGGPDISNLEMALDSAYIILKNRYLK